MKKLTVQIRSLINVNALAMSSRNSLISIFSCCRDFHNSVVAEESIFSFAAHLEPDSGCTCTTRRLFSLLPLPQGPLLSELAFETHLKAQCHGVFTSV